jgi:hypothetical protein
MNPLQQPGLFVVDAQARAPRLTTPGARDCSNRHQSSEEEVLARNLQGHALEILA